jgi:hypothetical protein
MIGLALMILQEGKSRNIRIHSQFGKKNDKKIVLPDQKQKGHIPLQVQQLEGYTLCAEINPLILIKMN